jgi:hypothetical protein
MRGTLGVDSENHGIFDRSPFARADLESFERRLGSLFPCTSRVGLPQGIHGDNDGALGIDGSQIKNVPTELQGILESQSVAVFKRVAKKLCGSAREVRI